jgi:hypothetical protein
MTEEKCIENLVEKLKGTDHLEDLDVDVNMIIVDVRERGHCGGGVLVQLAQDTLE